jgi:hypothetical protein
MRRGTCVLTREQTDDRSTLGRRSFGRSGHHAAETAADQDCLGPCDGPSRETRRVQTRSVILSGSDDPDAKGSHSSLGILFNTLFDAAFGGLASDGIV